MRGARRRRCESGPATNRPLRCGPLGLRGRHARAGAFLPSPERVAVRHPGRYEMRDIINALLCQGRTGSQRDLLPHEVQPPSAVKYYFCTWRDDGTDQTIHDLLR
ncbi:transposase [Streptomyces sp. NPDC091387]|uniref:transposase n=1 Tax=Streptomyces sp. NPDC091387 TaxID=3365998 RepID=UPI0038200D30